jgi:hypothetical protein
MADDPLNLDAPGEWAGLWWLPGASQDKVPGVLRFAPIRAHSLENIRDAHLDLEHDRTFGKHVVLSRTR